MNDAPMAWPKITVTLGQVLDAYAKPRFASSGAKVSSFSLSIATPSESTSVTTGRLNLSHRFTNLAIFLAEPQLSLPSSVENELATIPHLTPPTVLNAHTADFAKLWPTS